MKRNVDLLNGKILPSLTALALPIMATSMLQMAYNLTDMAWIGRVGSHAVTAVGTAGMYTWLSSGIVTLARMGGQVKVAHSLGQGEPKEATAYARGALQLTILLALFVASISTLFATPMIGFFGLSSESIIKESESYLRIICGFMIFSFLNQTLTGLFTAIGDSKTPLIANFLGLGVNMILDPILIFGLCGFPRLEASGAAIATVLAQSIVTGVFFIRAKNDKLVFHQVRLWNKTNWKYLKTMLYIGIPSSVQSTLYCGISMVLTRLVAQWGDSAIAVQRVGGQLECVSWMTAEGFGSAMNAFTGQNYGARAYDRVKKCYYSAVGIMFIWGLFSTGFMVLGAESLFQFFVKEPDILPMGINYIVILGYSQLFLCEELMTVGALQGMGKTMEASIITVLLTGSRIPIAFLLNSTSLGLNGIWWTFTATTVAKGVIFVIYYLWMLHKIPRRDS